MEQWSEDQTCQNLQGIVYVPSPYALSAANFQQHMSSNLQVSRKRKYEDERPTMEELRDSLLHLCANKLNISHTSSREARHRRASLRRSVLICNMMRGLETETKNDCLDNNLASNLVQITAQSVLDSETANADSIAVSCQPVTKMMTTLQGTTSDSSYGSLEPFSYHSEASDSTVDSSLTLHSTPTQDFFVTSSVDASPMSTVTMDMSAFDESLYDYDFDYEMSLFDMDYDLMSACRLTNSMTRFERSPSLTVCSQRNELLTDELDRLTRIIVSS